MSPWNNRDPIRAELFSVERLEEHARSLAAAQPVTPKAAKGNTLAGRLADNEAVLLDAYRTIAKAISEEQAITPAAEWLLDNYHLVERQIREIREDLPPGYYRQLPKLAEGPFAGYPRVFGVAWAFVAHTDSHFDPEFLHATCVHTRRAAADDRRTLGGGHHPAHRARRESAACRAAYRGTGSASSTRMTSRTGCSAWWPRCGTRPLVELFTPATSCPRRSSSNWCCGCETTIPR